MEKMQAQRLREIVEAVRQAERKAHAAAEHIAGPYRAAFGSGAKEIAGAREYVRGDDARTIDARATARTGVPHVRTLADERGLAVLLMIDVSGSGTPGSGRSSKRELAAEVAGALAFAAVRNDDRVGLLLFTDRTELYLPPGTGRAHVLRILREILFLESRGRRADVAVALDHAMRVQKRRAVAFLFSDFLLVGPIDAKVSALRTKLAAAGRRHDVVAVSVTDPRELGLPDVGVVTLEDIETGERVEIDTSSAQAREAYRRAADRYYAEIAACIREGGADHVELSTAAAPVPALVAFLGRRRGR